MMWLNRDDINNFLSNYDYDIRKINDARWIDQKCTPDVVCFVADCILQYMETIVENCFTVKDVWYSDYSLANVTETFKKPKTNEPMAISEYDKFFAQPIKLLAYAGILNETKRGRTNYYKVENKDLLEFIALREKNALLFLELYITKVLQDSEIYYLFETFFDKQTKETYRNLKDGFEQYTIANTSINGVTECRRIFSKILNPLAFSKSACGTKGGRKSKNIITLDMLMYNRDNFRDIYAGKPKGITRKQWEEQQDYNPNRGYTIYVSQKAKRIVKAFNDVFRDGKSEYDWESDAELATQIHHIFPESSYPEIAAYCENLIALTPNQHYIHAHPRNNTNIVDRSYQHLLLIAKAYRIEENLTDESQEQIYEFSKFMFVLDYGLDKERFAEISNGDYETAINEINLAYM